MSATTLGTSRTSAPDGTARRCTRPPALPRAATASTCTEPARPSPTRATTPATTGWTSPSTPDGRSPCAVPSADGRSADAQLAMPAALVLDHVLRDPLRRRPLVQRLPDVVVV